MNPTTLKLTESGDSNPEVPGPAIAMIVSAIAMLAGAWFGFRAWQGDTMPYGAYAVILLFAAPSLAVAAVLARNFPTAAGAATPVPELLERLRRIDASLRALRLARAHVCVGASYVGVLGISLAAGMIGSREFVIFYAAVIASAASVYLPWTARQEERMHTHRTACQSLLDDQKAARTWAT